MQSLQIDSREDYCEWYKNEYGEEFDGEMFESGGIHWNENYFTTYMPTKERLEKVDGEDWY